jgi:hypothetical protein
MNPKQAYSISNSSQIQFTKVMNDGPDKDRHSENDVTYNSQPPRSKVQRKHREAIHKKTNKINNMSIFKHPQDDGKKAHLKYKAEELLPKLYRDHTDMNPELFRQLGNTSPTGSERFDLKKYCNNGSKLKNKISKKYDNVVLKNPDHNYSFDINKTNGKVRGKFCLCNLCRLLYERYVP